MNASEQRSSSNSPGVADDWDNDDGDTAMQKQLEERFKQVRILQREKADKDARIERARAEEEAKSAVSSCDVTTVSSSQQNIAPAKMQILRRPKSGDQLALDEEKARKEKEDRERLKKPTLEERQAAYDLARNRIMGSDYKPEQASATPAQPIAPSTRNRSPEQIRLRKSSPESIFMPVMQPMQPVMPQYMVPHHAIPQHSMQHMPYPVPMTTSPSYLTYFDASRPPPVLNSVAGPSASYANPQQPIPTYATGQYFGAAMGNMCGMRIPPPQQPPPQQIPYGRPPVALYPPGTFGAAMQLSMDVGQSQAQRKNRHNKKKSKMTATAEAGQ